MLAPPIFVMTSELTSPKTPVSKKKCGRQGEGGGRPRKQQKRGTQSGRTISQQPHDELIHGTPCDDDFSHTPMGLSREDGGSVREMRGDVFEMA